jgi:hypothetical protein
MKEELRMTLLVTASLRKILIFCVLLFLASGQLFADKMLSLKWSELSSVIAGHNVELAQPDGSILRGKVLEVLPDAMVLIVTKSSGKKAFPIGRTEIPRAQVAVLNLTKSNANKGVLIGALIGIPLGIGTGKLQGVGAGTGTAVLFTGIGGLIGGATQHATMITILPD